MCDSHSVKRSGQQLVGLCVKQMSRQQPFEPGVKGYLILRCEEANGRTGGDRFVWDAAQGSASFEAFVKGERLYQRELDLSSPCSLKIRSIAHDQIAILLIRS